MQAAITESGTMKTTGSNNRPWSRPLPLVPPPTASGIHVHHHHDTFGTFAQHFSIPSIATLISIPSNTTLIHHHNGSPLARQQPPRLRQVPQGHSARFAQTPRRVFQHPSGLQTKGHARVHEESFLQHVRCAHPL